MEKYYNWILMWSSGKLWQWVWIFVFLLNFIENEGDEETLLEKCSPNIRRLYEEKKARFTGSTDDPINRKAQKSLMKELYYLIYQEHKEHKDFAQDCISETVITKL